MIEKLHSIVGRVVDRLFFIVWPPYGESDPSQMDISAGFVFDKEDESLFVISTDKDDLTTPYVYNTNLPIQSFYWNDFNLRIERWMNCAEDMIIDSEYYEVTNQIQFSGIVNNKVLDVELVEISNDNGIVGVKVVFENDFILSTPISDGNTIETSIFNRNSNLDNFRKLGDISFISIKNSTFGGH